MYRWRHRAPERGWVRGDKRKAEVTELTLARFDLVSQVLAAANG